MYNTKTRKLIVNEYLRIQYLLNPNQGHFLSDLMDKKIGGFHPFNLYIEQILNYYIHYDKMTKKEAQIKLNGLIGFNTNKEKIIY
jgi:hypothetical protein